MIRSRRTGVVGIKHARHRRKMHRPSETSVEITWGGRKQGSIVNSIKIILK
jgi:hypothetical protein